MNSIPACVIETESIATLTSKALLYATCTSPIMHLICPPKFCITFVFHFSWVLQPKDVFLFVCFILAGPNLIFFNERARGLPSGIVLGQTSRPCVSLDTGLTSAKLHYLADLSPQTVKRIEVSKRLLSSILTMQIEFRKSILSVFAR